MEVMRVKGVSPANIERLATAVTWDDIISDIQEMRKALLSNDKPDWRAREVAIKTWLAYVVGLPVQRQEIVQHKITSAPTARQLLANPAAVQAVVRAIAADPEGRKALAEVLALEMPA